MFIDRYFTERDGGVSFTREQGSDFAKGVAGDFNPLHDPDAKRFCIPGDLLFSVVLAKYGVSRHMEFVFSGMVDEGVELLLPEPSDELVLLDTQQREYLRVERSGGQSHDEALIQNLTRSYVEFSGHTFPHILEPLLAAKGVMHNPQRPMVIYASMSIDLDTLDVESPVLEGGEHELQVDGRRGEVKLAFNLVDGERRVGSGCKRMLLSGLREYDAQQMRAAIEEYDTRRRAFLSR